MTENLKHEEINHMQYQGVLRVRENQHTPQTPYILWYSHTANRKVSERLGLTVYLCLEHHEGNEGVHHNRELDLKLKRIAQRAYEADHSRQEWMSEIGKNYLD